jgi:branched-chain amino acid transport system substrate-binding protein
MNRRSFLTGVTAGSAALAVPAVLRAQSREPIKIGLPLPLTGPFGAIATDMQRAATLAAEEVNAAGGVLGRRLEILFRDDQLKPGVGAQRAKELIENENVQFLAGVIAAHVQMAVNEQAKKARIPFISLSQSDEITAKPDWGPHTFHEALNPTNNARAIAPWAVQNLGKRWWVLYADYAWGKQNNAGFTQMVTRHGGTVLGSTPYPLGSTDFSAHLPRIQAAKPDVLLSVTPGADGLAALKQMTSFGMKKQVKVIIPVIFLFQAKEAGAEVFSDVFGGINFYWELEDTIPSARRFVQAFRNRWGTVPDAYAGYGYSGIKEIARGVELARSTAADAFAEALRTNPVYDHHKGKQWWRPCDHKSFQDLFIVRGREPGKTRGEWGLYEVVARLPASEEHDRTCAEKGHA